jgi:hypothetical protein
LDEGQLSPDATRSKVAVFQAGAVAVERLRISGAEHESVDHRGGSGFIAQDLATLRAPA